MFTFEHPPLTQPESVQQDTPSTQPPTPEADALEAGRNGPDLSRTVSAPPYSIYSPKAKSFIVAMVSVSSLISPFGATTFYPALDVLAAELHVTPSLINLALTTYMIAQGLAPSLIAGMSDESGRRLSYLICFVIFIVANIGLALQTNYAALLVLRMLQAFGCSAAIALSTAVVADIATSAERGKYMGYTTAGLLFGPAFGPTIGGLLCQYLGWRSTFWFLAIFTAVLLIMFTFFFPETCRNVVGNGSTPAKGLNQSVLGYLQHRRHVRESVSILGDDRSSTNLVRRQKKKTFPKPWRTLKILTQKESGMILFYNGLFFTGMMIVTASVPTLYKEIYNLNELQIGLCYMPLGIGSLTSALTMGHVVDWNFRRHARRLGIVIAKGKQQDLSTFPIERVRFQVVIPGHIIGTFALVIYGWTLKFHTSLAGPEIGLFFVGFGVSTAFNITNTLLIDLHRHQPATATAAVNFVRCLLSAGGAAAVIPMCQAMNIGWAFTFIALVYVVLFGMIFLLMAKGQQWRTERRQLEDKDKDPEQRKNDPENSCDSQQEPLEDSQSLHEKEETGKI
ncbi:hypothetical protein M433DRAFT_74480 [Acidomyces richmondensis BFW]|nr:MAG: hypothetical protein FE78DRAFT_138076 [Acidomyces sp. 'richmondensis']KYG42097.1 hypothetical protein M433DRAFT_74480 [Acidomyces richmondensis BFW]